MSAIAERLDVITTKTGVKEREVAELLGTTPQTVHRWRKAQAAPQSAHLRRILDLAFAAEELALLYTPDQARVWLYSRSRLLGGKRPVDLIVRDDMDSVLQAIAVLKDGAYA
jgi:transcriptional regulator with XRE-family HTH domain